MTFIDFDICNLPATLPVLYSVTLTYLFKIRYFTCHYLENSESQRKTVIDDICRFQYLLSNGIIANVILFDLNLLFQGQTSNVNISKTVKASAKLHLQISTFAIEQHHIANAVLFDLDLALQGQIFQNVNISKTVRASAKVKKHNIG